jgi:hypothetical protein
MRVLPKRIFLVRHAESEGNVDNSERAATGGACVCLQLNIFTASSSAMNSAMLRCTAWLLLLGRVPSTPAGLMPARAAA